MLNLFGIDINKIVIYIAAILIAVLSVMGGYFYLKHSIRSTAQLEFNNKQLEQVVNDQKQTIEQLQKINKDLEDSINDLNKQNDDLNIKLKSLDDYLNSEEAIKDDRPSSNILKRTIKEIIGASK